MKHSRHIALVLLGSVSAVALAGCKDDTPQNGQSIYESVQQCQATGRTDCDSMYARALSNHVATGPRYSSQESCMERGHERCMNVGSGATNIWLPAMVGFMAGRAMDATRPVYLQGYQNPTTERERQDRQVVAGGTGSGGGGAVFVGSYHGGGAAYAPGSLGRGMSAGATRAGVSASPVSAGRPAVAAPSAAARGGFGAAGAGAAGA